MTKPFMDAMQQKYCQQDVEDRAVEVLQLWEDYLKDPDWQPYKRIKLENSEREVVRLPLLTWFGVLVMLNLFESLKLFVLRLIGFRK